MKFAKPWFRKSRGWYVTLDGRQINLGKTKKEALARYHQLMATPQKRSIPSDSLLAIIDAFLDWVQRNRAVETYEWYRYRLQRFAQRYPNIRASELKPYHVETWVDGYSFSVTSRRNYLRSVKRCMKWAKKQGYIERNSIEDLEVPSAEAKERALSQEEFETLVSFIRNTALLDLMRVTWETGCRPQESLRVEARHVDLANQRWVFYKSESKTKRITRVVYLTDKAFAVTKRLMLANPEGPIFRNSASRPWTRVGENVLVLVENKNGQDVRVAARVVHLTPMEGSGYFVGFQFHGEIRPHQVSSLQAQTIKNTLCSYGPGVDRIVAQQE